MSIYEILPIENNGMSVITVILFFGAGVFFMAILKWIIMQFDLNNIRFKEHDIKFKEHDECVQEMRNELANGRVQFAELKGSIQNTENIVSRIEKSVSELIRK